MKKLSAVFLIFTTALLTTGCQSTAKKQPDSDVVKSSALIQVDGKQFIRNGAPYYFVGTNFWYGAYLGASEAGRTRLKQELDLLKATGIDNLRVLALSEKTTLKMAVKPAIQTKPGVLNEDLLTGLDVLLDEMAKREMVAVLYLNNFWQWSGGMAQYRAWQTGEPPFDPDETGDWNGFMQNSARFYSDEQSQIWYQSAIKQIIERRNSVNGKYYREDPTIMSWQLANEPRPGSDEAGLANAQAFLNWIDTTASYIKSLDSQHLVSIGSEGEMGTARHIALYQQAHQNPNIDYATFHLWPKNWSWLDIKDTESTLDSALAKAKSYVIRHIKVANKLNKPTVMEEFGIERDGGAFSTSASTQVRDDFYAQLFSLIESQAQAGTAIAGSNFWTWGGYGEAKHDDYLWRPGDDFTGDPPQEHQGLNSVFASDHSTLEILETHSKTMNALNVPSK